jgi:hypothetical protein
MTPYMLKSIAKKYAFIVWYDTSAEVRAWVIQYVDCADAPGHQYNQIGEVEYIPSPVLRELTVKQFMDFYVTNEPRIPRAWAVTPVPENEMKEFKMSKGLV